MPAIRTDGDQRRLEAFLPRRDRPYLAVTAAVAFVGGAVLLAAAPSPWLWPSLAGFALCSALISAGDAVTQRIPNLLNLSALGSAVPLLALAAVGGAGSPVGAATGAAAAFAVYFGLWLVAPSGMGMGDVKLAPYLGAHLGLFGLSCWWHGLFYGVAVQGVVVAVGLATGRLRRGDRLAHGPAMCLGAAIAVLEALLTR